MVYLHADALGDGTLSLCFMQCNGETHSTKRNTSRIVQNYFGRLLIRDVPRG